MKIFTFISFVFIFVIPISSEFDEAAEQEISKSFELRDFLKVLRLPISLSDDDLLHVEYSCSNISFIKIYVEVQTETQKNFPVFKRFVNCTPSIVNQQRAIRLKLPRYIIFRPSFYNKFSVYVNSAVLKIWMVEPAKRWSLYNGAEVKLEMNLQVIPPFQRPHRISNQCFPWYDIRGNATYSPECQKEEEVVSLLSYPLALTGDRVGLVKEFTSYKSKVLEKRRTEEKRNSSFTFVFWIYVVDYCPSSVHCSIMHHATWDDDYLTPLFLINKKGQLHIEMVLRNKQPVAYITSQDFVLPKNEWVQLVISCKGSSVWSLHMKPRSKLNWTTTEIVLPKDIQFLYDDRSGIYFFGGSDLQPSFRGYFGEITFIRRRAIDPEKVRMPPPDHPMFKLELSERDVKCRFYKNKVSFLKLQAESLYRKILEKKSCLSLWKWIEVIIKRKDDQFPQCKIENAPRLSEQYKFVRRAVRRWVFTKKDKEFRNLASQLVDEAYKVLAEKGLDGIRRVTSLLKQSSCYGNHDASFMLATILNHGVTVKIDESQSHSHLLSGGLHSNRLCLLSLANKHVFALDGIPYDLDQAYVYYMSVAYLTKNDVLEHNDRDTITETVRLTDEVAMKSQTDEKGDLFLWLKHQASQGIFSAQQNLARMLYWGSQGVKRNTSIASSYYKAAAASGNEVALYDYGILLLKGHGIEKNITKAMEYFQMAAAKKHPQAINTLGWYALIYKKNYSEAANYFEEAFRLGNPDAGHNLAHMLLSGIFPELNRVERVLAWDFFSKAALGGNYDSGLLVAKYNMVGHPKTVRTPSLAVEWARYLAEQNPAVGKLLKHGVVSFREQNWSAALVYYLMAASSGVEVANFNLAFLCEENYDYLTSLVEKECAWRHYNLSALRSSKSSNPYAWLKMADYYYMHQNINLAASTYADAAARGDPQGMFNLALMVENDDKVPDYIWKVLGISFAISRNKEQLLIHLYSSCRDSHRSDAFLPCLLALWRTWIKYFWIKHGFKIISSLLAILIFAIIFMTSRAVNILRRRIRDRPSV